MDADGILSKVMSLLDSEDIDDMNEAKTILWNLVDSGSKDAENVLIDGFSQGKLEFDDESEMFCVNKMLAQRGVADAMLTVGLFCMEGVDGWPVDEDPRPWFEMADRNGCPEGGVRVALLDYIDGDAEDALPIFQKESSWSDLARLCLGAMYWNGDAVPMDREKAKEMWDGMTDADPEEVEFFLDGLDDPIDIGELVQNVILYPQYPE